MSFGKGATLVEGSVTTKIQGTAGRFHGYLVSENQPCKWSPRSTSMKILTSLDTCCGWFLKFPTWATLVALWICSHLVQKIKAAFLFLALISFRSMEFGTFQVTRYLLCRQRKNVLFRQKVVCRGHFLLTSMAEHSNFIQTFSNFPSEGWRSSSLNNNNNNYYIKMQLVSWHQQIMIRYLLQLGTLFSKITSVLCVTM